MATSWTEAARTQTWAESPRAVRVMLVAVESADSGGGSDNDDHAMRKRAKSAASPTSSSSASAAAASPSERRRRPRRKGKTPRSYVLQREEKTELKDHVRHLHAQLELLKIRAGLSTLDDPDSVASRRVANARVERQTIAHHLELARFHSLVTCQLQSLPNLPMDTPIHLPVDPADRRRVLDEMHERKLRRGRESALARLAFRDQTKPYKHQERSLTAEGWHRLHYVEVQQFRGLHSARQLFDALLFYRDNLEICVSDMLGQITVREDLEQEHPTVRTARLVTTGELGGLEELHILGFARFYDSYAPHDGAPLGVVATATVDTDELYPYKPLERTRKSSHSVYTISDYREPGTNELVVVLTTDTTTTQLPPAFALPPAVFNKTVENMPRWFGAMNRYLREATRGW